MPVWPETLYRCFLLLASRFDISILAPTHDLLELLHTVRRQLMVEVAGGSVAVEVVQALCMLALVEISGTVDRISGTMFHTDESRE